MIVKAAASEADAVCIDLEDSVPAAEKEASRANVVRAFAELDFGKRARMFRINGLDTSFAYRDLIDVVEAVGDRLDLVMVPKVELAGRRRVRRDAAHADRVASRLRAPDRHRGADRNGGRRFWTCARSRRRRRGSSALIFGAGDYAASMRMPAAGIGTFDANDELYPGHRWHA